jgi:hypothetical protein
LQRALRLSEQHATETLSNDGSRAGSYSATSEYQECTPDRCIAYSEANSLHSGIGNSSATSIRTRITATEDAIADASEGRALVPGTDVPTSECNSNVRHGKKRRRIQISLDGPNARDNSNNNGETIIFRNHTGIHDGDDDNMYYLYSQPIRVPRTGREMGSTLFLVILFNLALAHHLKATTITSALLRQDPSQIKILNKAIRNALMLYQLVLDYWSRFQQRIQEQDGDDSSDDDDESSTTTSTPVTTTAFNHHGSIRFRIFVFNNLGQLYKWTKNGTKERECLRDLFSAILVVTDQNHQHGQTDSSNSSSFKRDLEGFLTNTAALTRNERCAKAA